MKTYVFKVVVEPDDDRWSAYCAALLKQGAATWGYTPEEAFKNIQEVVQMMVAGLLEEGQPIPGGVRVSEEALIAVTVREVLISHVFAHSHLLPQQGEAVILSTYLSVPHHSACV